jgi:hypothetical protein
MTWDWNYPALAARNLQDIEIIRDSDRGFICSPTEMSYSQDYPILRGATHKKRIRNLIEWVNINWPLNLHLLQASDFVRLHAEEIGPEWKAAEQELDQVCGPYLCYVRKREPTLPGNLKDSEIALLSRPIKSAERSVLWRRAARIGLRRVKAKGRSIVLGGLRRIVRRL